NNSAREKNNRELRRSRNSPFALRLGIWFERGLWFESDCREPECRTQHRRSLRRRRAGWRCRHFRCEGFRNGRRLGRRCVLSLSNAYRQRSDCTAERLWDAAAVRLLQRNPGSSGASPPRAFVWSLPQGVHEADQQSLGYTERDILKTARANASHWQNSSGYEASSCSAERSDR